MDDIKKEIRSLKGKKEPIQCFYYQKHTLYSLGVKNIYNIKRSSNNDLENFQYISSVVSIP